MGHTFAKLIVIALTALTLLAQPAFADDLAAVKVKYVKGATELDRFNEGVKIASNLDATIGLPHVWWTLLRDKIMLVQGASYAKTQVYAGVQGFGGQAGE